MPANIGRNLKIRRGATVIAGIRTKGVSMAGDPVDITSDDDSGFRTLLAEEGQRSIDLSIEGVTKDNGLRSAMLSGSDLLLTDVDIEWPNGDTLTGNFFLSSLEENGTYNDAVTFSGSLQSSGTYTFTAAP